jgi:thioredoxin 2
MAPAYERAAAELEPDVRLLKVDTEKVQEVAVRYDVRSIPTLMVFVSGEPVARIAGAMGTKDIVGWVREHARPPRGVGEAA